MVLSQGVFPDAPNTTVNIVVMAPFDGEYLFRKELVEPSVDYAMASILRDLPTALRNIRFNITYRDSHCSRKAAIEAVNFYYGRCGDDVTTSMTSPILFLGPVCNDAASMVATFAENWNVPIISPGAHAAWLIPGGEYPLLNRITPSYTDLSYFIHGIFLTLMHGISYPVHLVYSDDENGRMTERECHNVMQAIYTVFNNDDIELQVTEPYVIRDVTFQPETFITELGYPRVVLMCAPSHLVRKV
uniref:Receptor ligand binding region domain-containing protein n=1 Tax=Ciona savignyi TaxID=51511 RepID=H2Y4A5_CIOSA